MAKYTLLLLLLLSSTSIFADTRLGVVDRAKLLESAPQADAARNKLQQEFAPRDEQLLASQQKLKELEGRLEQQGATLPATERRQLERDIVMTQREVKRERDAFREDFNIRRNEELAKLQKLVYEAIVQAAKEGNYDLVLSDGVIYAGDKVNITNKVLTLLKTQYQQTQGSN